MSETVAQYAQSTFTSPVLGETKDPAVILANDNNLRTKHNNHDADGGIHLQSSVLASRPAAGASNAGWKWLSSDGLRLYYSNGSAWSEVQYLSLAAGGTVAGATTFSGGLTVSAGTTAVQALTATSGQFSGQVNITGTSALQFGSSGAPATGTIRLPNARSVAWRNGADSADVTLTLDSSNVFQFTGAITTTAGITATTGTFSGNVSFGSPATTTGATNEPVLANAKGLRGANAAGTNTAVLISLTAGNVTQVGPTTAVSIDASGAGTTFGAGISATTGTFSGALTSTSASGGVGYGTGAGGTVTQATNRGTAVTLNKTSGRITMVNANHAAGATVTFQFVNSTLGLNDVLLVQANENFTAYWQVWAEIYAAGNALIYVKNINASDVSEATRINFAVIKGVTS